MKVFVVLSVVVACAFASDLGGYGGDLGGYGGHYAAPATVSKVVNLNTGHSTQTRKQDAHGNYAFAYEEQGPTGGTSREESGDAWGNKVGSYSLNVGDGRQRIVKYVADGAGFRASIKTNEPGIVASAPAATSISTPHGHDAVPAPVVTHVGGYAEGGYGGVGLAGGYGGDLGYAGAGLGGVGLAGNGLIGNGLGLGGGCAGGLCGGVGLAGGLGGYGGLGGVGLAGGLGGAYKK